MKRLLIIFTFCCLLSIIAFAQAYLPHTRSHFKIAPTSPSWPWGNITNNTDGTLPYAWYVAQYYYTNGSTVVLPDLYTNKLDLTNSGATSKWPIYGATLINGSPAIQFDGSSTYLKNIVFTNSLPHDICMVMYENGTPEDSAHLYFDSSDSSYRELLYLPSSLDRIYFAGNGGSIVRSSTGVHSGISNKWIVVYIKAGVNQGYFITNNINSTLAFNAIPATMSGITLGSSWDTTGNAKYNLAEFISYAVTNSALQRSNIYAYLTNKYSLP